MNNEKKPPFAMLYAGLRPKLAAMKDHHAGLVYMYLLTRRGPDGQCNPAVPTIAKDLNLSERTVKDAKALLKRLGVLNWTTDAANRVNFIFTVLDIRTNDPGCAPCTHPLGTSNVPTLGTSGAPTLGTSDIPTLGTSGAPRRIIHQEQSKEGESREGEKSASLVGAGALGAIAPAVRFASSSSPALLESGAAAESISPTSCANQIPSASQCHEVNHPVSLIPEIDDEDDGYPAPMVSLPAMVMAANPVPAAQAKTHGKAPAQAPGVSGTEKATSTSFTASKRTSKARNAKAQPLTDERKATICASAAAMESYLLEGQLNWRRWMKPDAVDFAEQAGVSNWTAQQFAGFWWWRVSDSREVYNQPIILPDFGRLMKEISRAMDRMSKAQLLVYLGRLIGNWHLVRFLIGGPLGFGLMLNESIFNHSLVRATMDRISAMDENDKAFWLAKMAEEWQIQSAA